MNKKKEYEQHMSSIEIADITGKTHEKVMEAIKKMEDKWKVEHGREFMRVTYHDENRDFRTCYFLTKEESLYVAYQFSMDTYNAVINRWEMMELELMRYVFPNTKRIEVSDDEILEEANDIINEKLTELNRTSKNCHRTCEIARLHDMSAADLLSFMTDQKIMRKVKGHYELTRHYRNKGLEDYHYKPVRKSNGKTVFAKTVVWTEEGKRFIQNLFD